MISPSIWEEAPVGFELPNIDAPLVALHPRTGAMLFKLHLDENERRQLIEGNPLYLMIVGPMNTPLLISANLADVVSVVRGDVE